MRSKTAAWVMMIALTILNHNLSTPARADTPASAPAAPAAPATPTASADSKNKALADLALVGIGFYSAIKVLDRSLKGVGIPPVLDSVKGCMTNPARMVLHPEAKCDSSPDASIEGEFHRKTITTPIEPDATPGDEPMTTPPARVAV